MPRAVAVLALLLLATPAASEPCATFRFLTPRDVVPLTAPVLRAADVTGDGRADLLTLDATGTVYVEIQQGDGGFVRTEPLTTTAFDLVIGDVDGDGRPDAVLLTSDGPRLLRVGADGALSAGAPPASTPPHLGQGRSTAFADLDGDGRRALLVTLDDTLWAWRLTPEGSFQPTHLATAPAGATLVTGDFDGDGHADVLVANPSSPLDSTALSRVLRGDGHGQLVPGPSFPLPQILSAASGDLDGDGRTDLVYRALVTTSASQWTVSGIARGDASDGVAPRRGLPLAGSSADPVLMADLDGDGRSDVVESVAGGIALFRGAEGRDGTVTRAGRVPLPGARLLAVADLDGDGRPDLLLGAGGRLLVSRNVCGDGR